jgi:23S rRNA (cytidine1920-2'-O)/16S rRNA (cytidine1409-2'-O)-methyltransferase
VVFKLGKAPSRSRALEYVKQGHVYVNGKVQHKAGFLVYATDKITVKAPEDYVSRAGLKLASVADDLGIAFRDKIVLDVGSSTGGFTEFALRHGAQRVIAVDVGTQQLHPKLHNNNKIELYEKTDIRDFVPTQRIDTVVMDVSFISVRNILPHLHSFITPKTDVVVMVKPQFEAGRGQINKGVIKNDTIRRKILKEFEQWVVELFTIVAKADSKVAGAKGNIERFYLLHKR